MSSDEPSGSRLTTPAIRLLERDLRRKGHLADDEHIIDWCSGDFIGLYENGEVSSARPRTWLPWARPLLLASYTDRWVLFGGRRFSRSLAIQAVIRAEVYEGRVRVLYSLGVGNRFSLIEFKPVQGPIGDDPQRFVTDLIYRRDIATAGFPHLEEHMEGVRTIRSIPAADLLGKVVLASCGPG